MARSEMSFLERAQAHWNKDRVAKVTGGKRYVITPDRAPELLRAIGLLNADATMSADCVRKFTQINHMISLIRPSLDDQASRHGMVRVLDAGCGNSYLTFLIAWYFRDVLAKPARIIGIDMNERVIESSRRRSDELGFGGSLRFARRAIERESWREAYRELFPDDPEVASASEDAFPRPHVVVALHACDTATDQAMSLAIHEKADVMAVAPCCHAELAALWARLDATDAHPLQPVFANPNIRRDAGSVMTDTMRMLLARRSGYEVTTTEFVPSEHTPKNRLLLCVRRGRFHRESSTRYDRLRDLAGGTGITLEALLSDLRGEG